MDRLRSELSGPLERLCVTLFAHPRSKQSSGSFNDEATGNYLIIYFYLLNYIQLLFNK